VEKDIVNDKGDKMEDKISIDYQLRAQRECDTLFKQLTGKTNPPRIKEDTWIYDTIRFFSKYNKDTKKTFQNYYKIK